MKNYYGSGLNACKNESVKLSRRKQLKNAVKLKQMKAEYDFDLRLSVPDNSVSDFIQTNRNFRIDNLSVNVGIY